MGDILECAYKIRVLCGPMPFNWPSTLQSYVIPFSHDDVMCVAGSLVNDLRAFLSMRFPKSSKDHDLQEVIRDNIYLRTVPCAFSSHSLCIIYHQGAGAYRMFVHAHVCMYICSIFLEGRGVEKILKKTVWVELKPSADDG